MPQMVAAKKKKKRRENTNCGFTVMLFGGEVAEVRVFDVWSLATDPAAINEGQPRAVCNTPSRETSLSN